MSVGDLLALQVMIVNINPYDTGYDENSHVMKFASLAKEIFVTPAAAPLQKPPPVPFMPGKLKGHKFKEPGPLTLKDPEIVPKTGYRRKVTISMGGNEKGKQINQAILEVLEGRRNLLPCISYPEPVIDGRSQRTNPMMKETTMTETTSLQILSLTHFSTKLRT